MPFITPQEADSQTPLLPSAVAPMPPQAVENPGALDVAAAAFRQSNILSSAYDKYTRGGYDTHPAVPGYDPYANNGVELRGYEGYADKFTRSTSPEQTQQIKNQINAEQADREVLGRAGASGYIASMAAGAVDPIALTSMFIPGLEEVGAGRLAKIGATVATNVAAGEAQQAALATNSETTNYADGLLPRAGVNALLAGVLGGIATRVPRAELDEVAKRVGERFEAPESSTAGAMAVQGTTLADESIAKGGQGIAKTVGQVSPVTRVMTNSRVVEARRLAQQLTDPGVMLEKNLKGIPTLPSVEMRVNQIENVRNAQIVQKFDAEYADYKLEGGELTKSQFGAEVEHAMRNEDAHEIKQVRNVAQFTRPIFIADNKALTELGVFAKPQGSSENMLREFRSAHPEEAPVGFTGQRMNGNARAELVPDPFKPDTAHLETFEADKPGNGAGTEAMKQITELADKHGVRLTTDAVPQPTKNGAPKLTQEELNAFYAKHGFKPDPNGPKENSLVREPKPKAHDSGPSVIGAPSYFPRVYDQHMIMARRTELEQRLTDWFTQNPKIDEKTGLAVDREPAEIKSAVYDTLDHIQGTVRGTADVGHGVRNPAPLKGRRLDVPDSILAPFLSHDFESTIHAYNRTILPQIEMRRMFGSTDLEKEFRAITDAYHVKLNYAKSDAAKAELLKQQAEDMRDLTAMRDRVLHQVGPRGNESLNLVRAAQIARSFNYLRTLGGQTLSAFADVGRLVTRYGLANTGVRLSQFLTRLDSNIMRTDAQRMGTALDTVLHTRAHTLDGIGDEMAGSQVGQRMRNATARFTQITGIAAWDSMMRTLSSQLEQDALYRAVTGNVSKFERAKLASHGIGDAELAAIREQWTKHGSEEGGLNRARTELWTDRNAAELVETAVQRAASSTAFFVGKGDMPLFANSQLGKMIVQFKAFAISSVNRLAIPLAQGLAHGDVMAANGLASMLALGALTYYTKELAAGRKPDLSADRVISEAVQRSGILTFLPDLYDPIAGTLHLPRFAKFQDLNPLETAMGATFGAGATLLEAVRRLTKGNLNAADIHKLRQMLPYQNLFYFARLVNMVEGKIDDALGVKNAPGKRAADYLNPAQDEAPKSKPSKQHLFGIEAIPNEI